MKNNRTLPNERTYASSSSFESFAATESTLQHAAQLSCRCIACVRCPPGAPRSATVCRSAPGPPGASRLLCASRSPCSCGPRRRRQPEHSSCYSRSDVSWPRSCRRRRDGCNGRGARNRCPRFRRRRSTRISQSRSAGLLVSPAASRLPDRGEACGRRRCANLCTCMCHNLKIKLTSTKRPLRTPPRRAAPAAPASTPPTRRAAGSQSLVVASSPPEPVQPRTRRYARRAARRHSRRRPDLYGADRRGSTNAIK